MKNKIWGAVLLFTLLIFSFGCAKRTDGSSSTEASSWIKYQPMKCDRAPWEQWYLDGNITFVKAPTDKELVVAYYSRNYKVNVLNYTAVMSPAGNVSCDACSVCPKEYYVKIEVLSKYVSKMKGLGWQEV